MGTRTCPAKKQLETRIKNDKIHRDYDKLLKKDTETKINNVWRANDLVRRILLVFVTP